MDIKWKNISKQIFMWIAVAVICVCSYFAVEEVWNVYQVSKKGEDIIGNEFSLEDYFNGSEFEQSTSYREYVHRIISENLKNYIADGKIHTTDQKLKADVDGEIQYKKSSGKKDLKQKIQYGDSISKDEKKNDRGIILVETTVDENKEQYFDENDRPVDVDTQYELIADAHRQDGNYLYGASVAQDQKDKIKMDEIEKLTLTMRIPQAQYESVETAWRIWQNQCMDFVKSLTIYIGIALAAFVIVILSASPKSRSPFGKWVDEIWLEILLIVFGLSGIGAAFCGVGVFVLRMNDSIPYVVHWSYGGMILLEILCGYCFISLVRRIKEHRLIKSAICYKALHFTKEAVVNQKNEWDFWKNKQSSMLTKKEKELNRKRWGLIIIGIAGVICTFFLLGGFFPFGILFGCFMVLLFRKQFRDYQKDIQDLLDLEKVLQQIYEISNGNLRAQTDIGEESLYYKATKDLESIGQGMEKSVEEQLKGERMKIDLITNVSHDLKTPLTSIISYVDLLSKDESLSEEAKDYVAILGQKSERLKNIVIDLFDLAKTTSGNAKVDFSILDMRKLVEQTLVEMEDKIQKSGFEIVTDFQAEQAHFEGDANRMYRVVQNILENALKYSLAGSRIFITVDEFQGKWRLSMKNTAAYRMEFTEEEILERFNRGDKSRTTEGSGLGLSIAESFTKLCGGEFGIKIDGDQFTAQILFPKKFDK